MVDIVFDVSWLNALQVNDIESLITDACFFNLIRERHFPGLTIEEYKRGLRRLAFSTPIDHGTVEKFVKEALKEKIPSDEHAVWGFEHQVLSQCSIVDSKCQEEVHQQQGGTKRKLLENADYRGAPSKRPISAVLPRGWLEPEWVHRFSRELDEKTGKVIRVTSDIVDKPNFYLWLRQRFPYLTPSQYRTSLRRLIGDMGPGYNNNKIDEDVASKLRVTIAQYGKKSWGFQRKFRKQAISLDEKLPKPRPSPFLTDPNPQSSEESHSKNLPSAHKHSRQTTNGVSCSGDPPASCEKSNGPATNPRPSSIASPEPDQVSVYGNGFSLNMLPDDDGVPNSVPSEVLMHQRVPPMATFVSYFAPSNLQNSYYGAMGSGNIPYNGQCINPIYLNQQLQQHLQVAQAVQRQQQANVQLQQRNYQDGNTVYTQWF